jgi:hypothetical protein
MLLTANMSSIFYKRNFQNFRKQFYYLEVRSLIVVYKEFTPLIERAIANFGYNFNMINKRTAI